MKKSLSIILSIMFVILCMAGCTTKSELHADEPVTLTMWHVYGEQADSPMNRLIDEFNKTIGKEKGIVIDVTMMSNSSQIGGKLLEAQADLPGAPEMPDLFFCHSNNADALGTENLINWHDYFSDEELNKYVPEFVKDGIVGETLSVFPVSKSTHLLFVSGGQFERFSAATGVTYESLLTWEGFFDAAEKYYEWSGGKSFCAFDYLIRSVELNAISKGAEDFYTADGWYDFENEIFKSSWMEFAESLAKGHIVVSDLYSNTQVMTGDVISGMGSSASILYYNDTVTYADNSQEPIKLKVLPAPQPENEKQFVTQAGVGLCAYKTTTQKAEAAAVFAKWLTESDRNLSFVTETGYMPVNNDSFDKIENYTFKNEAYKSLYETLVTVRKNCIAKSEPSYPNYYDKVTALYNNLRAMQNELKNRYASGEDAITLAEETWNVFCAIK